MKTGKVLVIGCLSALAVTSAVAQGARRDGRWEVKIEMEMAGMTLPPQTALQCVTKEEAADPQKAMPQGGRGTPNNCKVSDYKMDGNKVNWSVACDQMTGAGEFVYSADTLHGHHEGEVAGQRNDNERTPASGWAIARSRWSCRESRVAESERRVKNASIARLDRGSLTGWCGS